MSLRHWLGFAVLAACGPSPAASPVLGHNTPVPTLAQAHAYERGAGVPRDYSRAAEIYAHLCNDGAGDLDACNALVEAIRDGRGVTVDLRRLLQLEAPLCKRGDAVACALKMMGEASTQTGDVEDSEAEATAKRVDEACGHGDGRACLLLAQFRGGDGSSAEHDRRDKYGRACRAGLVEGCGRVAFELVMCGEPEVDDTAGCEARALAEWRGNDYDRDRVDAAKRIADACTAGDAVACKLLPSRRQPRAELCAAHDYAACADLGCIGDDAAEKLALDHGVTSPNCYVAGKDAYVEWRAKHVGFPPIVSEHRQPIGKRSTPPFDAARVTHHGGRDRKGWPRYDLYNINDQPLVELLVCAYAYDHTGTQIARIETSLAELPLAPNAITTVDLAHGHPDIPAPPAATVTIEINYERVRFGTAAPAVDPARCPADRPIGSQQVYGW